MKGKIVVLGAGLVSRPAVRYLLTQGFGVTVASRTVSKAQAVVEGFDQGRAVAWTTDQVDALDELVGSHDLAISLLPAPSHPTVARACIKAGKHMVTTSYVSPEMQALDEEAKAADIVVLNEIGVDPGIDHMSIMKVIDYVRGKGGQLTSLRSCCGGLPAPEANTNPLGYKFSWSPAGVLVAMTGPCLFLEDGERKDHPPGGIFDLVKPIEVEELGQLEHYPNRDSLQYIDAYGLEGIATMYRGTFRYPGWCHLWKALWRVGLLDRSPREDLEGRAWGEVLAELSGGQPGPGLRGQVAAKAGVAADDPALDQAEWLGLLGAERLGPEGTLLDCVAALLNAKMIYAPGERDMLLMEHDFIAAYPDGSKEKITSIMLDFGEPEGDTSMARTVSLPAAIGARLILESKVASRGVLRPVVPELYEPVLAELGILGISLKETFEAA